SATRLSCWASPRRRSEAASPGWARAARPSGSRSASLFSTPVSRPAGAQRLARVTQPPPRPNDVRPVRGERDHVELQVGEQKKRTPRTPRRQRLLDPLDEALRLQRERLDPDRKPLVGWAPHAVQRKDDANDARGVVTHALDEGEPVTGSEHSQERRRRI